MLRNLLSVFLCVLPFLAACRTSSKQSSKTDDSLSEAELKQLNDFTKEVDLGRNMAGRLLRFYGQHEDEKLVRYVNAVGLYLTRFLDNKNRHYMFAILDTKKVNAFACPGAYILITLGAIQSMENEAELAMVLSHEIAHVEGRHLFETIQRGRKQEQDNTGKKELEPLLKMRDRTPKVRTSDAGEDITRYLLSGSAGVSGATLIKAAESGIGVILEKGLDKELEFEADENAIQLAVRAGYDPYALKSFLTRLEKNKKTLDTKILETTHPKFPDRIEAVQNKLNKIQANEILAAKLERRFQKNVEIEEKK